MATNIIFSLDTDDEATCVKYAEALARLRAMPDSKRPDQLKDLASSLFAIKIGVLNIADCGLSIVRKLSDITRVHIICDLKLADIPEISEELATKVYKAGADFLVIQGFVGDKVIQAVKRAAPDLGLILVSEMTHNDGGFTQFHLRDFGRLAREYGLFGVIGPGNRPERLRLLKQEVGSDVAIIAAGVSEDQGGSVTAARDAGADYFIQGREIRRKLDRHAHVLTSDAGRRRRALLTSLTTLVALGLILGLSFRWIPVGGTTASVVTSVAVAIVGAVLGWHQYSGGSSN